MLDEELIDSLVVITECLSNSELGKLAKALADYVQYGDLDYYDMEDAIIPSYLLLCYIFDLKEKMVKEKCKEGEKKQ
ncbi:MAG: hypothetical protein LUI60_00595 [Clostridia bacterium]|nr:hypothetical protein [Clostridia bacterium]MCD8373286.1 hypothetical protein [Clostridia bacterium]